MREAPRSSSSPRSWKGRPQPVSPLGGSKRIKRLLMSVLVMALTGGFIAILWWIFWLPRVHVVALPITDYGVLAVPPVRYSREDIDLLESVPTQPPLLVLQDLEAFQQIRTLGKRLPAGPRDSLILYVRGHGVSENGVAWLLCSDYSQADPTFRYRLQDLLDQVEQSPARFKLLLLDTHEIAADPRLGMIVNEFPRLVEEVVRATNDPNLWVLSSCRPLETSHVCEPARCSVFGYFVTQGLRGAAHRGGGRWIDLDEFVNYVRRSVSDWVWQATERGETQSPWLLRGGVGVAEPVESMHLVPFTARPEEAAQDGTIATPGIAASNGAASGENVPGPNDKSAAAPVQPAAAAAGASLSMADDKLQVALLLEEAWKLRDQLQNRSREAWIPTDYAPHLWREYQATLLGYQRQYRAGSSFPSKSSPRISARTFFRSKSFGRNSRHR